MRKISKSAGFTLIEIMFVSAIMGVIALAFSYFMGSIGTAYKSQMDLETRVDLFQTLNFFQRVIDCQNTIKAIPAGTVIPDSGLPITLVGGGATAVQFISEFGTKKGKFSYIADIFPGNNIKVRAAAFKTAGDLPRNRLTASNSEFLPKKVTSDVWSWATTDALIDRDFSALAGLCGDASMASGGGASAASGKVQTNCEYNAIHGFICYVINTQTGATCIANPIPKGLESSWTQWNGTVFVTLDAWRKRALNTKSGSVVNPTQSPQVEECTAFVAGEKVGTCMETHCQYQ